MEPEETTTEAWHGLDLFLRIGILAIVARFVQAINSTNLSAINGSNRGSHITMDQSVSNRARRVN